MLSVRGLGVCLYEKIIYCKLRTINFCVGDISSYIGDIRIRSYIYIGKL